MWKAVTPASSNQRHVGRGRVEGCHQRPLQSMLSVFGKRDSVCCVYLPTCCAVAKLDFQIKKPVVKASAFNNHTCLLFRESSLNALLETSRVLNKADRQAEQPLHYYLGCESCRRELRDGGNGGTPERRRRGPTAPFMLLSL